MLIMPCDSSFVTWLLHKPRSVCTYLICLVPYNVIAWHKFVLCSHSIQNTHIYFLNRSLLFIICFHIEFFKYLSSHSISNLKIWSFCMNESQTYLSWVWTYARPSYLLARWWSPSTSNSTDLTFMYLGPWRSIQRTSCYCNQTLKCNWA